MNVCAPALAKLGERQRQVTDRIKSDTGGRSGRLGA